MGGKEPVNFHDVIDNPDLVSRVIPPAPNPPFTKEQ
jgi:hypothetical protein